VEQELSILSSSPVFTFEKRLLKCFGWYSAKILQCWNLANFTWINNICQMVCCIYRNSMITTIAWSFLKLGFINCEPIDRDIVFNVCFPFIMRSKTSNIKPFISMLLSIKSRSWVEYISLTWHLFATKNSLSCHVTDISKFQSK
jgi:hypothetical protein